MGGAALQEGCAAHLHLHQLGLRQLGLSKHTWGERTPSSCFGSSCSPSLLPPCSCSCSSGHFQGLKRAQSSPKPRPLSSLRLGPALSQFKGVGWSSLVIGAETQGARHLPDEAGRGATGLQAKRRPLSFQAPPPSELRGWECRACARLGHTGPFVSPHPGEDHSSPLCPPPPNPSQDSHKTHWSNPGQKLPFQQHLHEHPTHSGAHSGNLVSMEGSESLAGFKTRPGSGQG